MNATQQRRNRTRIALNLIGIEKATSQLQQTKALKALDYICLIIVCASAGYFATMQGFDSLPLNADALAPFEEAKSFISNPKTDLFSIHVSRIASIFPGLTINALLQLIFPKAGFLEIFSLYAWCTSSLFILLATLLTNTIKGGKKLLTADSIKISLITILLLNISHPFNITYSHFITPVHHGGNVLNTLLILTLAVRSLRRPSGAGINILLSGLTVLAVLSNKVAIFTAVTPSAMVFLAFESGVQRRNHLITLVLATSIGIWIGNLFNAQCATPGFDLLGTLSAFQQYFQISWITSASALFSASSIIYAIKSTRSRSELPLQTSAGLAAISMSSLSYFIYLPMLPSRGEAPLRYICIAYALITVFLVFYINIFGAKRSAIALLLIVVATLVSFQYPDRPKINVESHRSLKQELLDRSDRIEPFKNDAANFINQMGYNSYLGLGDYWMSGATLASNSKIEIIPIKRDGRPDFWGATPQDVRRQIKSLSQDKTYLLTDEDRLEQTFEKEYGAPIKTWNYDSNVRKFTTDSIKTNQKIQIFDNPDIYNKIRKHSEKFKRQCNRSLPIYRAR